MFNLQNLFNTLLKTASEVFTSRCGAIDSCCRAQTSCKKPLTKTQVDINGRPSNIYQWRKSAKQEMDQ